LTETNIGGARRLNADACLEKTYEMLHRKAPGAPETFAYCHMNLIARRGIYNFENLDLDDLSADKAYEFLFAWAPLKLVGATGSPGNPVAAY